MNGDLEDVTRSLRRHVALIVGSPPFKVRLDRQRVADDDRPIAVVEQSGALVTLFSRAGTTAQGDVRKQATFTIVCYPQIGDTAAESRQIAGELAQLIDAGFERGLVTDDVPAREIGAPWRVPIYDYAGVPLTGPDRGASGAPYAYLNVDDTFNTRPIQDPIDERRYTVVATARVDWWRGGRGRIPAPTAQSMQPTVQISG